MDMEDEDIDEGLSAQQERPSNNITVVGNHPPSGMFKSCFQQFLCLCLCMLLNELFWFTILNYISCKNWDFLIVSQSLTGVKAPECWSMYLVRGLNIIFNIIRVADLIRNIGNLMEVLKENNFASNVLHISFLTTINYNF